MAFKPSKRAKHGFELEHTNITPMMNLMVVLIPLLLTSAEFVKLGVVELNLPPAAVGPESEALAQMPIESFQKLDLAVTITNQGFFISSAVAVLSGDKTGEPTIPLKNGEYDFSALSEKLFEIKNKAKDRFADIEQIILMAELDVDYQTVISTMDAARMYKNGNQSILLFPDVSLSAGIF
ncbi:biopolymer transporter ExbD [candidate division KSB1 bacterium]|nr:biopolymer transporter ExbD [candidate division KSB1 bacterium]